MIHNIHSSYPANAVNYIFFHERLIELRDRFIIDILAYPKEHLIENNFEPLWFGIEVKSPFVKKEPQKNVLDFAKQAIDYTESEYDESFPILLCSSQACIIFFMHTTGLQRNSKVSFITFGLSFNA